jgi:hypothetical protein
MFLLIIKEIFGNLIYSNYQFFWNNPNKFSWLFNNIAKIFHYNFLYLCKIQLKNIIQRPKLTYNSFFSNINLFDYYFILNYQFYFNHFYYH